MKKIYSCLIIFLALISAAFNPGVQASPTGPVEVFGVHHGKPGAQITLVDNQVYSLETGVEQALTLKLISSYSHGEMHIRLSSSEGLVLQEAAEQTSFVLGQDKIYEVPLRVSAAIAGRHYVHLHIDVSVDNREMFKSISAIIQAQSAFENSRLRDVQKAGARENNPGDEVISLPAQEEILIHQLR